MKNLAVLLSSVALLLLLLGAAATAAAAPLARGAVRGRRVALWKVSCRGWGLLNWAVMIAFLFLYFALASGPEGLSPWWVRTAGALLALTFLATAIWQIALQGPRVYRREVERSLDLALPSAGVRRRAFEELSGGGGSSEAATAELIARVLRAKEATGEGDEEK